MKLLVSIKNQIINHICYRDVFNAPVAIESLRWWMGIDHNSNAVFNQAIEELEDEKLIVCRNGFLAVTEKDRYIDEQVEKSILTKKNNKQKQAVSKSFFKIAND